MAVVVSTQQAEPSELTRVGRIWSPGLLLYVAYRSMPNRNIFTIAYSFLLLGPTTLTACSESDEPGPGSETGGSGGSTATGGTTTGGSVGNGGVATGGHESGGSTSATGGAAAGGSTGNGGAPTSGGAPSVGGAGGGAGGSDVGTGGMDSSGGASGGSDSSAGGSSSDEPCPESATLTAGDTAMSLTVGGNEYPFNVHAPPAYDGVARLPVVFDFHGLGGNENQMQNLSGWADTGDTARFITVFPGGVDNAWNAGGCCSDTPTDVEFVREAVAHLDAVACIDKKRIYASGCSNGGAMSYRLACEASDVIAAVAPVDFDCVVGGGCGDCDPERPVTEIQFRGTDDTLVPYSGAEPNFERWGEINECSGTPEALSENASCQRYPMCSGGVESILCTVEGGSHCGSYGPFGISDLAWDIISQYSLP